jgi:hypothetical protein
VRGKVVKAKVHTRNFVGIASEKFPSGNLLVVESRRGCKIRIGANENGKF